MNKRYLHHLWTRVRRVKLAYLLAAFALCVGLAVGALRSNYSTMVDMREAVYKADRDGEGVEEALQELRAFVGNHMNTSLTGGAESVYPPIQLSETYKRLQAAERARHEAANANLYTQAQQHCERLHPDSFSGGPRVPCIEEYVRERGSSPTPIPDEMYKFDFASPRWSPDFAGWSLVLAGLLLALAVARYALGRLAKKLL